MSLSLAQVLPLAMFILMVELVVGSFAVMLLADFEGDVGSGFLGLNALIFTGGGAFAPRLGGAVPGMLLGHWYLVAPNLSPRPLRHMTIILFAALAWQLLSLPVYLGLVGSSAAARQGAELLGSYGLILGVRLAIGLLFPLV